MCASVHVGDQRATSVVISLVQSTFFFETGFLTEHLSEARLAGKLRVAGIHLSLGG